MDMLNPYLSMVYWQDIREEVAALNPEMAAIIDVISPDKRYPLLKASYRFGDLIVKDGVTYLPQENAHLAPISAAPENIKDQLSYSAVPLFITLKNACEVFIHSSSRAIPLNLFYPGSLLGVFESVDSIFNRASTAQWCVSAGSRSIFTLPKLNELGNFKKLKVKYGLASDRQPHYLTDHWSVFSELAQHPDFEKPWRSEVIYFTKAWLMNNNDSSWFLFREYLFKRAWQQAQFAIDKISSDLYLEYFYEAISRRRLKPTQSLMNQVKHILLIAIGGWPGFKIADETEQIGPIVGLQNVIMDVYNLKKYYPSIMHASSLERDAKTSLYYSVAYPSLLERSFDHMRESTIMRTLREIKLLLDTFQPLWQDSKRKYSHVLSKTQFDYFHVEEDMYQEIGLSKNLPAVDKALINHISQFPEKKFCASSQFWRGCILISHDL